MCQRNKILSFILFFMALQACNNEKTSRSDVRRNRAILQEPDIGNLANRFLGNETPGGLSAGIYYNGRDHFYNYGKTGSGDNKLPDQNTLYEIGSITKIFTSLLLANAVQNAKLNLNDQIIKYLPDSVAENASLKSITLQNLANHTSGLPRKASNSGLFIHDPAQPYKNYTEPELFSYLKHYKAGRNAGISFEYSNVAFNALGVILERVYNKSYEELLDLKITRPLQLKHTSISLQKEDIQKLAQGYDKTGQAVSSWKQPLEGAGSIISTVSDMLLFGKQQLASAKNPLSESIALTHQPTFQNEVALGWHFMPNTKDKVLIHSGATAGFSSIILINLDKSIVLVVLANRNFMNTRNGIDFLNALSAGNA